MKKQTKRITVVEKLCQFLGRQNFASKFLDYVSSWLFPQPAFAYSGYGAALTPKIRKDKLLEMQKPLMMARPPAGAENFHGPAPSAPHSSHQHPSSEVPLWKALIILLPFGFLAHESNKKEAKHASVACSDPLYKGMHGAPCKFEGGSDNKCPKGTVSGWWWSYEVPGKGRIYYVDCCGGSPTHAVFCNWTNEANWCQVYGKAVNRGISDYNCTLAILEADMNTKALTQTPTGSASYPGWEVVGVDP